MNGSKQAVVYIHGGDSFSRHADFLEHLRTMPLRDPLGEGSERWSDRLRTDLGDAFELYQLAMPNKNNAQYIEWKIWFERHVTYFTSPTILIGWSLGGMFLLKYLAENKASFPILGLAVVASPAGEYAIEAEPGNDCQSFEYSLTDLPHVAKQVDAIAIFHSEDDFVVPFEHAQTLHKALPSARLATFHDRNHFLQPEFPELIEQIRAWSLHHSTSSQSGTSVAE